MKTAVISDIHGNLEAFKEVLADMDRVNIQDAVCLGDNVGYGPDPEEVVRLLRGRGIPSVMGNHELALTQPRVLQRMNPSARKSVVLTRNLLSPSSLNYLKSLQPSLIFHGALCVHGCPPDSVTTYLFTVSKSRLHSLFQTMKERICFAGHSHDLELIGFNGKDVICNRLNRGLVDLDEQTRYIVNVGSVGQPRDGTNHAKYLIWNTDAGTIDVRFVPYDIAKTANKIIKLGFPASNATRLW